jgi:hypothetical protein
MSDHDLPQRRVLGALLAAHPRMLGLDEIEVQLAEVPALARRCVSSLTTGSRPGSATASA